MSCLPMVVLDTLSGHAASSVTAPPSLAEMAKRSRGVAIGTGRGRNGLVIVTVVQAPRSAQRCRCRPDVRRSRPCVRSSSARDSSIIAFHRVQTPLALLEVGVSE